MYATFSDDRVYLYVYNTPDQEEPDILSLEEFMSIYGEDALPDITEPRVGDLVSERPIPRPNEVLNYLFAFRSLVTACGKYKEVLGLKEGVMQAHPTALEVFEEHYGSDILRLNDVIKAKEAAQYERGHNLSRQMRTVGYKPLSFEEDARRSNDVGVSDADCLIRLFSNKDIRKRTCYRIDKYIKKVELRSPLEILKEVKKSFGDNIPEEFKRPPS